MKYLDKTSLTEPEKCDLLTDGVYDEFQSRLLPATILTTEDWLQKAIRVEMALHRHPSYSKPSSNKDIQFKQFKPNQPKSFALSTKPPNPCRYCQYEGREEWHWHSLCPIKAKYGNQSNRYSSSHSNRGNNPNQTDPKTLMSSQTQQNSNSSRDSSPEIQPNTSARNNFAQPMAKAFTGGSNGHPSPFPELNTTLNDNQSKQSLIPEALYR